MRTTRAERPALSWLERTIGPLRPDPEQREHRDRLLRLLIPVCGAAALMAAATNLSGGSTSAATTLGLAAAGSGLAYVVHRSGRGTLAGILLILALVAAQYRLMSLGLGIHDIAVVMYPALLIVVALMLDLRLLLLAAALCLASAAVTVVQDMHRPGPLATDLRDLADLAVVIGVTTIALRAILIDLFGIVSRARLQEREVRDLNAALARYAGGLEASEARWRTLIETAPDRILSVAEDGRIDLASDEPDPAPADSLVGRPIGEFTDLDSRARLEVAVREAFVSQRPARLEVPGWTRAGDPAWYALRVAPVVENGRARSVTLIATDIRERKQNESEREALIRELEARNAELEGFTYTVSHDLKSPLITIRAFLGFVEKNAEAGDLAAVRADIARIADTADRMRCLLDDLLDLSRVGRIVNPMETIGFETLAREAIDNVQGLISARGVDVSVAGRLPVVHVDRTRAVQVLQNLLENAVKFLGEQPQPRVVIGQRGWEGGLPIFYVQDNGAGIDPRFREKVFGLFEKLDPNSPGTGVGLALVRRIVEYHGGRIWVESEGQGRGATFLFTLPLHPPDAAADPGPPRSLADS